jgi:hypothetical protein
MYETVTGIHLTPREEAMLGAISPLSRVAAREVVARVTDEMVTEAKEIAQDPDFMEGPRFNKLRVLGGIVGELSDKVYGSVGDNAEAFLQDRQA